MADPARPHRPSLFAALALLTLVVAGRAETSEPRLWMDAARITALRQAVTVANTPLADAYAKLKSRVDGWRSGSIPKGAYDRSTVAKEASIAYVVTSDASYATLAYNALSLMYSDPEMDGSEPRVPDQTYGLSRANTGMGFAVAYDFCQDGWTTAQRDWVRTKLIAALDAWVTYSHSNLSSPYQSNWVGVCRGAEICEILVIGQETARASRLSMLKTGIAGYITELDSRGWSDEGNGYTEYALSYAIPAVNALRSIGDTAIATQVQAKPIWKAELYAFGRGPHLTSGVDSPNDGEGFLAAMFPLVATSEARMYQWWYDHFQGYDGGRSYDRNIGGDVWFFCHYPIGQTPQDPNGVLPLQSGDATSGMYYFRNRWRDGQDTAFSITADAKYAQKGWNVAEATQLNLVSRGTTWFATPSKETTPTRASTLLVDGVNEVSSKHTGTVDTFVPGANGGGYVIVDGGQKYQQLGLTSEKRHCLVDFTNRPGELLLSTLDRIAAAASHTYAFQLNTGTAATLGSEGGRPTFTVTKGSAWVKGWVLHPANATLEAGSPLRVKTAGATADIWVVMTTGTGTAPAGAITGTGLASVLTIGSAVRVRFDSGANRIVSEPTGTVATHAISGHVTVGGAGLSGVTVSAGARSATTDASGAYAITGLADGAWTVTPSRNGYGFTPASRSITLTGADATADFTATAANAAPTVATAAAASPATVAGTTTTLSALGADDGGEAALSYTWATTGTPPAAVTFSANGGNAAKATIATFSKAGSYQLQVTIRDAGGLTATSSVTVTVQQTATTLRVTPATATVQIGTTQRFTAAMKDQFGAAMTTPATAWSVSGGGTIASDGTFTATTAGGPFTVTASAGGRTATASVTVSATFIARINVQPASAPTVPGWLVDSGATFGLRDSGRQYGWSIDISGDTRDRNAANSADQLHDTLIHTQKSGDARWEIACPNGSYSVHVVCGDASYVDSVFKLDAEGVRVVDGTPTSANHWIEGTVTVTVSDGRLILTNASGATNTKVCLIEVTGVPAGNG